MPSMEERFPSTRGALGFPPDRRRPPETVDLEPRLSSPILERFRAFLRDLEEDLRSSLDADESDPLLPTTAEIVQIYEDVLSELTINSKPIITDLTMIAGEQREHAKGVADAICTRILEVPAEQKLSSLYLLDSIVKNIGGEYVRYFSSRLPKVFCEAYSKVHSSMHPALRHLFGTWSQVFPSPVLRRIEDNLLFSEPDQGPTDLVDMRHSESPSLGLSHSIHVNPNYLEDVKNLRGVSSTLQVHGQMSSTQYGDYDFNRTKVQPLPCEMTRVCSPRTVALRATPMIGVEGPFSSSKGRASRPSPPPRIGLKRSISPSGDRFEIDISPGRFVQRPSPSHSGRMSDQSGWFKKKWPSDVGPQQEEDSFGFNPRNGYSKKRSRDLIDAYGNYRGKSIIDEKDAKVQHVDRNGINSVTAWKSSDEEECVWEDMSPTLADRNNRNSPQSFRPFTGSSGFSQRTDRLLESDFRRDNFSDQDSLTPFDDPAASRIPGIGSGNGSRNMYLDATGSQNQNSYHVQDHGKLRYSFVQHLPHSLSPRSQSRVLQTPFSTKENPLIGQRQAVFNDNLPDMEVPFRRLPVDQSDALNVVTSATEKLLAQRPYSPRNSSILWPTVHKSPPLSQVPIPPNHWKLRTFDFPESTRPVVTPSLFLPSRQYDSRDRDAATSSSKLIQSPYHHSDSVHVNRQNQDTPTQSGEVPGSFIPAGASQFSSHLVSQPRNGHCAATLPYLSNPLSQLMPTSAGMSSIPNTSLVANNGLLPLPRGLLHASSHTGSVSQNISSITSTSSSSSGFSGLISTLMAQGLISLPVTVQSQESIGVEFNADLLKVRHESTINALYIDLPRQCTTCGLRFKCQEEHSIHMDWHVTKNRISKNCKQKPSRRWFVNAKEWLSGAETVGTDATPGFLPTEAVPEKNEAKEMAVPAEEDQTACALCGEPFEDFYSDETEEWMYKEAVYLNVPNGNMQGLGRAQLGPIVHVKCISSESTDAIG